MKWWGKKETLKANKQLLNGGQTHHTAGRCGSMAGSWP